MRREKTAGRSLRSCVRAAGSIFIFFSFSFYLPFFLSLLGFAFPFPYWFSVRQRCVCVRLRVTVWLFACFSARRDVVHWVSRRLKAEFGGGGGQSAGGAMSVLQYNSFAFRKGGKTLSILVLRSVLKNAHVYNA